tara:strand:+ start:495 stop:824 length:330 start_codon:yes stop_codon:yes gene_type:complete
MSVKNLGAYRYSSTESGNVMLGQLGFDLIAEHNTTVVTPDDDRCWIAIKALGKDGGDAAGQFLKLKLVSNIGDGLSSFFFLNAGDILYGNFKSIVNHTDSTAVCIAYRG